MKMSVVIRPKTFREAYDLFIFLPFYSLKNFLAKEPIAFEENEIISVRKSSDHYIVHYRREDFFGKFRCSIFDRNLYQQYNKFPEPKDSLILFLKETAFSLQSPCLWGTLFNALVGYCFIYYGKFFFRGIANPEYYAQARCGVDCIRGLSWALNALSMIAVMTLGSLILSLLFYFVIAKKIKSARHFNMIKIESFLIFAVNVLIFQKLISTSIENNNFKNLWKAYQVVYNSPEKLTNNSPSRGTASK